MVGGGLICASESGVRSVCANVGDLVCCAAGKPCHKVWLVAFEFWGFRFGGLAVAKLVTGWLVFEVAPPDNYGANREFWLGREQRKESEKNQADTKNQCGNALPNGENKFDPPRLDVSEECNDAEQNADQA